MFAGCVPKHEFDEVKLENEQLKKQIVFLNGGDTTTTETKNEVLTAVENASIDTMHTEEKKAKALKKLRSKYDDISGVTWYHDKTTPTTVFNGMYAYIGVKEGDVPWVRLVFQYTADDYLSVQKFIIKADDQIFTVDEAEYGEIKTDHSGGTVWEWLDRIATPEDHKIIKAVAESKTTKIRYLGRDYYNDKIVSEKQKVALKNIMQAYNQLVGINMFD